MPTQDTNVISCDKNLAVIHLSPGQRNRLPFDHPLLDTVVELPEDQFEPLVLAHIEGNKTATDALIMGNLLLIKWIAGRYLWHWPETRRFSDDICSEGITAVTEFFHGLKKPLPASTIRAILVVKIKSAIETLMNDMRAPIYASLRTNFRRISEGREPEYCYASPLVCQDQPGSGMVDGVAGVLGRYDDTPEYIDVLDSLERLKQLDGEEMVDMILMAIEQQHNLLEADLTDDTRRLIKALSDAVVS